MSDADDANQVEAATARNVLEFIVESLVGHEDPDAVEIELDDGGRRLALNVSVARDDMGRVIGKRGRVAQAIRQVVRAAAARDGVEVDVRFVD
ncbi:MAG: KH domain-containing protein [Acidimicrobiales bacterium]